MPMARVGNTCGDPSAANMGSGYSSIPPPCLHYLCTDTIQVLLQLEGNVQCTMCMIKLYNVHPLCTDTMQVLLHRCITYSAHSHSHSLCHCNAMIELYIPICSIHYLRKDVYSIRYSQSISSYHCQGRLYLPQPL